MNKNLNIYTINQINNIMNKAILNLKEKDIFLLENDANEEAISHRLAIYIENHVEGWHVDCEYNRKGLEPKRIKAKTGININEKLVYPDIIVHRRNSNENLLAIEIKKNHVVKLKKIKIEKY